MSASRNCRWSLPWTGPASWGKTARPTRGSSTCPILRHLPNLVLMAPKDENELRDMLFTAVEHPGPVALRYPRGRGMGVAFSSTLRKVPIGKAEVLREGEDLLILALGACVYPALEAAGELDQQGFSATVVNARFVKPLDEHLILTLAAQHGRVLTVEENVVAGGFGSAVLELLADHDLFGVAVKRLAIPDVFVEHGTQDVLRQKYGLDAAGILKGALTSWSSRPSPRRWSGAPLTRRFSVFGEIKERQGSTIPAFFVFFSYLVYGGGTYSGKLVRQGHTCGVMEEPRTTAPEMKAGPSKGSSGAGILPRWRLCAQ